MSIQEVFHLLTLIGVNVGHLFNSWGQGLQSSWKERREAEGRKEKKVICKVLRAQVCITKSGIN